jgi:hypothetical protein
LAGSLIKIDEEIVSSAVASVTLTGIDSTYDVYMVKYNNVTGTIDNQGFRTRVTVSGTADSTANYDVAYKRLRADTTFNNISATNETSITLGVVGTGTGEINNGVLYLFNFNNASEYSFATMEPTILDSSPTLQANTGGFVNTVAQSCDGINFHLASGNIASGTFTLYGLKK